MSGIECFLIAPTDHAKVELRRYGGDDCSVFGYHDASAEIGSASARITDGVFDVDAPEVGDHDDPRWPTACACGYRFTEDDHWQTHTSVWWVGADGRELLIQNAPPGAIFDAFWMRGYGSVNGDGPAWSVVCPPGAPDARGHVWHIGSQASNCTRKGEDHDCWCCHGEAPLLTVNKQPVAGRSTCDAGGGSIQTGDWHGFLTDGRLIAV